MANETVDQIILPEIGGIIIQFSNKRKFWLHSGGIIEEWQSLTSPQEGKWKKVKT